MERALVEAAGLKERNIKASPEVLEKLAKQYQLAIISNTQGQQADKGHRMALDAKRVILEIQKMNADLRLRNLAISTMETYLRCVALFARHFGRCPDRLGASEVRAFLLHLAPLGGKIYDDQWNPIVNNEAGIQAAEALKTILECGPEGGTSFGMAEAKNAFLQGKAAMFLDTS